MAAQTRGRWVARSRLTARRAMTIFSIQPTQRVGDGEIDLSRVGAEQRRGEESAAVALARALQQRIEFGEIGVRCFVEARIVTIERRDAVHRLRSDRFRELTREHATVAFEVAAP